MSRLDSVREILASPEARDFFKNYKATFSQNWLSPVKAFRKLKTLPAYGAIPEEISSLRDLADAYKGSFRQMTNDLKYGSEAGYYGHKLGLGASAALLPVAGTTAGVETLKYILGNDKNSSAQNYIAAWNLPNNGNNGARLNQVHNLLSLIDN